jgi:hypothetical protein
MNGEIWDAARLCTLTRYMKGFGWETWERKLQNTPGTMLDSILKIDKREGFVGFRGVMVRTVRYIVSSGATPLILVEVY